jgi:hypothetical protein
MKKTSPRPRRSAPKPRRSPRSYTPLADALAQQLVFADTELSEGIQRHGLVGLLRAALGRQRRADGEPLPNVLCALLAWPLLGVKSLHCFCAQLCQFLAGQVSVLYDFLGREDVNWRGCSSALARRVEQANELGPRSQRAFVVDDTSQARAGRKVQGTSVYFDHTEGRHRKGHQVLQLGLAAEKGFLPLDAQLVTGQKGAVDKPKDKPFRDQRSAAARDRGRAQDQSKHSLFRGMLQRALRAGLRASSVHLAAIRYLLLFEAMLRAGHLSYGEIRDRESGRLQVLTYAALLWQLFRALIEGALDDLVRELGRKVVGKVLAAIDQSVEEFLNQALQISPEQVSVQLKAEELGYL